MQSNFHCLSKRSIYDSIVDASLSPALSFPLSPSTPWFPVTYLFFLTSLLFSPYRRLQGIVIALRADRCRHMHLNFIRSVPIFLSLSLALSLLSFCVCVCVCVCVCHSLSLSLSLSISYSLSLSLSLSVCASLSFHSFFISHSVTIYSTLSSSLDFSLYIFSLFEF